MGPTKRVRYRSAQGRSITRRGFLAGALLAVGCAVATAGRVIGSAPPAGSNATSSPETADAGDLRQTDLPVDAASPARTYNGSPNDWSLVLVNAENPLPEGYEPALAPLEQGFYADERCTAEAMSMMDACREAGLSPLICSAYRSKEVQEGLFANNVQKGLAAGLSLEDARAEAGKSVAVPGASEHQLGFALDIVDLNNQNLDETQESTPVQQWLIEHCGKFGFILRYPTGKSAVTGIIYEPWHYRYVGREVAEEIRELGVCLEEYLALIGG